MSVLTKAGQRCLLVDGASGSWIPASTCSRSRPWQTLRSQQARHTLRGPRPQSVETTIRKTLSSTRHRQDCGRPQLQVPSTLARTCRRTTPRHRPSTPSRITSDTPSVLSRLDKAKSYIRVMCQASVNTSPSELRVSRRSPCDTEVPYHLTRTRLTASADTRKPNRLRPRWLRSA